MFSSIYKFITHLLISAFLRVSLSPRMCVAFVPPKMALDEVDLYAPVTTDRILEVRTGKMKPLRGNKGLSGIDKQACDEPMFINKMGIAGDEHDMTFHGGVDKAVHGCEYRPALLLLLFPVRYLPCSSVSFPHEMEGSCNLTRDLQTAPRTTHLGSKSFRPRRSDSCRGGSGRTLSFGT